MAKKSSFDQEAKKKAIDKAMPEEETGIVQKIKRNVPIALKYLSGGEEAAYEQWKKGRDKAPGYSQYLKEKDDPGYHRRKLKGRSGETREAGTVTIEDLDSWGW